MSRLTGAALRAKVLSECRKMLAEDYGLPMGEYNGESLEPYSLGSDMQPIMGVRFKRQSNGREILIGDIYPADNGELTQMSAPELR